MKILVTGANGQVGGALLKAAPSHYHVTGLTRSDCDLSNDSAIHRLVRAEQPDWVINAAAFTAVDKAETSPGLAIAINGKAPHTFADALTTSGGRLFQISTDFVFDGTANSPYVPEDTRNPLSVYGKSKALGEDGAGESAIILRTSWVYGAGGGNFVRTMLRLMREKNALRVVADQTGSPSSATGIAKTIWSLIARDARGVFHHSDAGETTWHGFAVAIAEEAKAQGLIETMPVITPIETRDYPTLARRPAYSVLDDTNTRVLLGDRTPEWREALREMLKEEKTLG